MNLITLPLFLHAAPLLDDPIMLDWAINFYALPSVSADEQQQMVRLWFGKAQLSACQTPGRQALLLRLLRLLPAQHCAEQLEFDTDYLWQCWLNWPGYESVYLTPVLILAREAAAEQFFTQYLANPSAVASDKLLHLVRNLEHFSAAAQLAMLERLIPVCRTFSPPSVRASMAADLLRSACQHLPSAVPDLFEQALAEQPDQYRAMITNLGAALFGRGDLADHAYLLADQYDVASFTDMADFFTPAAPLAQIDQSLLARAPLAEVLPLLQSCATHFAPAATLLQLLHQTTLPDHAELAWALAALASAAVATAHATAALPLERASPAQLLAWLNIDMLENRHRDGLIEALAGHPKAAVLAALAPYLPVDSERSSCVALVNLLGRLGWPETVPALLACTRDSVDDDDDDLVDAALRALAPVREVAAVAIMADWAQLSFLQIEAASAILAAHGANGVAAFIETHFDNLLLENGESFHGLMENVPDARILAKLASRLPTQQPMIERAYYCQCRLLGQEPAQLAEIGARILKEAQRVQTVLRGMANVLRQKRDGPLILPMRCQACGATHSYRANRVMFSTNPKFPPLLAEEFACALCQRRDGFDLEEAALVAMTAEAVELLSSVESWQPYSGPLITKTVLWDDGSKISLNEAYARLAAQLQARPDDWRALFRLGTLQTALNRPQAAMHSFARSNRANPLAVNVINSYVASLCDCGQTSAAMDLLQQSLKHKQNWQFIHNRLASQNEFAERFNALKNTLGLHQLAALPVWSEAQIAKIGRNDPCLCGSGKKFKKCCQ